MGLSLPLPMSSRPPSPAPEGTDSSPTALKALRLADEAMLDVLQKAAFSFFLKNANPLNGLVADTERDGSPASIAVVGFALSAYPVGVERGWIERGDAVQRTLKVLRFFRDSDQSGRPDSTGCHGFYFHFLNMDTGVRMWQSELSLIDTALLIAGILTAAAYFTASTPDEVELREVADVLYRRVNWRWAQRDGTAVAHGWKPESGFLNYGWEGYSESILLYVLGLGSSTFPLSKDSFHAWTLTYQWENLYGYDFLYAGPLFIHQFSHAWIDMRGIKDQFMREKKCDYFENSRRATYIQREYAARNPRGFAGYSQDCWGFSAGDGPRADPRMIAGRRQNFYGYAARGAPYGPDDGTIAGPSMLASVVFAPEIALPAIRKQYARSQEQRGASLRASGFNGSTLAEETVDWMSDSEFGLDQGLIVMMIENFRSGLVWQLTRSSPIIQAGLRSAGFRGGWL